MTPPAASLSLSRLLAGYAPEKGVADEVLDATGQVRPVWVPFLTQLAALGVDDVSARIARGEQYLRDAGVYFRLYSAGPTQDREWPLAPVPVVLADAEWQTICDGLAQRAELLEHVLRDLYGPARLVADGHLPAELLTENPQWLRPMVGIKPVSGHWLHHLAFEVGRSPDGSFFVLADRAQAPSGAGFALENRMATTRIFSDPFPRANVRRLAGFFRAFRTAMEGLAGDGRRMALLTPGPNNDTYFEHTYIARYLGLSLVEGEDMIVENGQVLVRTVRGLEPIGLLWRRIDGEFCDPLELAETSQLGVPGLLGALRGGGVTLINAPGSGVLETRALMAFLPRLADRLLGVPLKMPNIATWWCGQPLEQAFVLENPGRFMIGRALDTALPFALGADGRAVGDPAPSDQESWADWIAREGRHLVAQEAVKLSTTPVWSDGRLVPRPMTIRVFAARTPEGWTFMPGGYARIGNNPDATALAMQSGGSVADVWVVAGGPVAPETLVAQGAFKREAAGILPARAADNLYWLGRYVERVESAIRLLRAWHLRLAESGDRDEPHLVALQGYLAQLGLSPQDDPFPEALIGLIGAARNAASKVRDRFSPDGWDALADLARTTQAMARRVTEGDDAARALTVLLRKLSGFSGLVHENMYHFTGWRFLSLGRAQERADGTLLLLQALVTPGAVPGVLEIVVEVGDTVMTHQRRYRFGPTNETVLDLMAQDPQNPRAVLSQVVQMRDHLDQLNAAGADRPLEESDRILLRLETDLRVARPTDLGPKQLAEHRAQLARVSDLVAAQYFR